MIQKQRTMKNIILLIALLLIANLSQAQVSPYSFNDKVKTVNNYYQQSPPCNCNVNVVISVNLMGQNSVFPIMVYTPASTGTFELMGYMNITNIGGGGQIRYNVAFTDENGTLDTIYMNSYYVKGYRSIGSYWTIRALGGTNIVVYDYMELPGTITYDVGMTLMQIN